MPCGPKHAIPLIGVFYSEAAKWPRCFLFVAPWDGRISSKWRYRPGTLRLLYSRSGEFELTPATLAVTGGRDEESSLFG
jgi:hypothetical protein